MAEKTKSLTRAEILAANDRDVKKVDVPEWGGVVYIRSLTAGERDKFENGFQGGERDKFRSHFCAMALCDEEGSQLFTQADVDDLTEKSGIVVDRIFWAAMRFNKMTRKDIEDLQKN